MSKEKTIEMRHEIFKNLDEMFRNAGMETEITQEENIGDMLRVYVDGLGEQKSDGDGTGVMELCFMPYENPEHPSHCLFQIFSTFVKDLDSAKVSAVLAHLNEINLRCTFGGFHVYSEEMQVYHKYVLYGMEENPDHLLELIRETINWIFMQLNENYDSIMNCVTKDA